MKLNKKSQTAIMSFLFIYRHKRATAEQIAGQLKLSKAVVNQVLRDFRIAGLTTVVKGPGGGNEIALPNASLWQVVKAVGGSLTNTQSEVEANFNRGIEGRVMTLICNKANMIMGVMYNQPLIDMYKSYIPQEIRDTLDVK